MDEINYTTVEHRYGQGHTVDAVLRLHNDLNMTQEELELANTLYIKENGKRVPSLGETFLIPVLEQYRKDNETTKG